MTDTTIANIAEETHSMPVFQNYACYRTKALGWQEAGYIIVTGSYSLDAQPPAPDSAPWWNNTAWVLDPDSKYQQSQTYPELVTTSDKKA
ncbi:hypothetical protein PT277_04570 [Acetobacteraceae bacterium ESL0709]|nr:hypothetical protein [Acetobacteraceae bacterium ESL0697]MDF7677970.1 hypothetical protein [Acetobacteraceae bacterium ESL0709]